MKYAFIAAHATVYRVEQMCRVLNVARSGYYAWHKRQPSQRARANTALLVHIRAIHEHSRCTYGSPRVHAALCQTGIACGRHRVARLMRQYELRACHKRRKRPKTTQPGPGPVAANILNREFEAQWPNEKWVTDIT